MAQEISMQSYQPFSYTHQLKTNMSEIWNRNTQNISEIIRKILLVSAYTFLLLATFFVEALISLPILALRACVPGSPNSSQEELGQVRILEEPVDGEEEGEETFPNPAEVLGNQGFILGMPDDARAVTLILVRALNSLPDEPRQQVQAKLANPQDNPDIYRWTAACSIVALLCCWYYSDQRPEDLCPNFLRNYYQNAQSGGLADLFRKFRHLVPVGNHGMSGYQRQAHVMMKIRNANVNWVLTRNARNLVNGIFQLAQEVSETAHFRNNVFAAAVVQYLNAE